MNNKKMNFRSLVLTILFLGIMVPSAFACFPVKNVKSFPVAAGYEVQKHALSQLFQHSTIPAFYDQYTKPHKCLVSKIGRGTMLGGGGLFVAGAIWSATEQHDDNSFYIPDGLILCFFSILVVLVGGLLAIGGGIYNTATNTSRYSFITPKINEAGVAFNLKR